MDNIVELRQCAKATSELERDLSKRRRDLEDVAVELRGLAEALDSAVLRKVREQLSDIIAYIEDELEYELEDLSSDLKSIADGLEEEAQS